MIIRYNFTPEYEAPTIPYEQLVHFRIAAVVMASVVILLCIVCVIVIKRNINVNFSIKVVALIAVVNSGFLFN